MSPALYLVASLLAQTPEAKESPLELFKREAAEYAFQLHDGKMSRLTLDSKPLLHWDNPARTAEDGAVFVWLKDQRPEVIGTIFTYKIKDVRRKHELHSLSTSPLTAEFNGKVVWKPGEAGVKFREIPDAPVPAENSRQRLLQMKSMAQKFSATITSPDGQVSELRLLPQPLYRYEPIRNDVVDGAIFSFALGTDPEVLLLLEARRDPSGLKWQYAPARFNYSELSLSHQGKQVWHVEPDLALTTIMIGDQKHLGKIYTSYHLN